MSDIVIEGTAETKIYLGDTGRIVILQSDPLGGDDDLVVICSKDIPAVIRRLRLLKRESIQANRLREGKE